MSDTSTSELSLEDLQGMQDAPRLVRRHGTDDERLLDLFWNRADLKKQYSGLKNQLHESQDEIKAQQKETQRVREEKRALEGLLADPERAYGALVYYQLRALWDGARIQLESFVDELSKQQRDRERKKQIMEFNQERESRLQSVSGQISAAKAEADNAKVALQAVEQQYDELTGLFAFFSRRKMLPTVEQHRAHHETARARVEELFDRRIKIESEQWPDYPGLSVEGKRVINLAVIAMAQHLLIHFSENTLASMSRVTTLKAVHDVNYGAKSDCEYLMNRIRDAMHSMHNERGFAADLRARSKFLRSRVEFKDDQDTIPVPLSIGNIPLAVPGVDLGNTVAGVPLETNVLIEDYWNVTSVLLR